MKSNRIGELRLIRDDLLLDIDEAVEDASDKLGETIDLLEQYSQ